jgi:hypothetical protein
MTVDELYTRFEKLVQMIMRDLPAMRDRIAALESKLAQLQSQPGKAMNGAPSVEQDADNTIVAADPRGRPITAKMVREDPKLRMRLQFSEESES